MGPARAGASVFWLQIVEKYVAHPYGSEPVPGAVFIEHLDGERASVDFGETATGDQP